MEDVVILDIFLQLTEQDVVNSKKAEKWEKCNDNDYHKENLPFFYFLTYVMLIFNYVNIFHWYITTFYTHGMLALSHKQPEIKAKTVNLSSGTERIFVLACLNVWLKIWTSINNISEYSRIHAQIYIYKRARGLGWQIF